VKQKLISIGAVALAVALLLTLTPACGDGEKEVKTLKVGVTAPLSGPAAAWGVGLLRGVEWRAAQANEAGGVEIDGVIYMLEVLSYDSGLIGSTAQTAGTQAVYEAGLRWIIGPILEAPALAVLPMYNDNKVVHTVVVNPIPLGADTPYTFTSGGGCADAWQEWFYKELIERHPEIGTTVVLESPGLEAHFEGCLSGAALEGVEVLGTDDYEPGISDFYPIMSQLLAENPDLLDLGCSPPGDAGLQIKQARELGFEGPIMANCIGGAVDIVIDIAGVEAVEGVICNGSDYTSPVMPAAGRELFQDYIARYDPVVDPMMTVVEIGWTNLNFFIQGWQDADSLDPDEFMDVVTEPGYTFPNMGWTSELTGTETMGLRRHIAAPMVYSVIENGVVNPVTAEPLDCP
jgi:branched-chain amino acid transport system substrate-binding protein